ncbi:Ribosomal protein L7Ae/L30e/S12e/Gadd45 [Ascosphaera apis ARSEF 7405]|uniref:Ribosomal protein L7Ae/L30e/S12e/Gadd45 n=1 Tax=Ascosphaera apis ARSEF 7405 TaxID=392613 RepID=A0A162IEH4_9EURO|nr:Ribosomal protein L7Ae/L30e/S12e/Gadd45 [Ascosphaera apis ARSEF 7405]
MAKDRVEKKEKKEKKDKKRSESDGVKKSKKEKKDKKVLSESAQNELTDKLLADLEKPAADAVVEAAADGDEMVVDVAEETTAVVKTDGPVGAVVPFANPLVEDKTAKKVLKSVKKAAANKCLKRGVKEVVKALRKSPVPAPNAPASTPVGVVVLAADISPMDVISHIPVLCEDHGIPYVFVTSRAELGSAGATKRPTSVVMVTPKSSGKKKDGEKEDKEEFAKVYEELVKVVEKETKKVKV